MVVTAVSVFKGPPDVVPVRVMAPLAAKILCAPESTKSWPEPVPVRLTVPVPVAATVTGMALVQQKIMPRLLVDPLPTPVNEMLPLRVLIEVAAFPLEPQYPKKMPAE